MSGGLVARPLMSGGLVGGVMLGGIGVPPRLSGVGGPVGHATRKRLTRGHDEFRRHHEGATIRSSGTQNPPIIMFKMFKI